MPALQEKNRNSFRFFSKTLLLALEEEKENPFEI
jgi:hypothetical protein